MPTAHWLLAAGVWMLAGCGQGSSEPGPTADRFVRETPPPTALGSPPVPLAQTDSRSESTASQTLEARAETEFHVSFQADSEDQDDLPQSAPPTNRSQTDRASSPPDALPASQLVAAAIDGQSQPDRAESQTPPDSAADQSAGQGQPAPELFVGWPQPDFSIVVTGRQHGYIEPCGCTGLANQKGGLMRRDTFIGSLLKRGWPVLPIDAGNQVRRFGRQAEIKFETVVQAFDDLNYQAVAFGPDDLRLSFGDLVALTTIEANENTPFMCANMALFDEELTASHRIVEIAGKKVGITAILGRAHQQQINNEDIVQKTASEGLRQVWPLLEQASCDLTILLSHASIEESRQLAKQFPKFDLIVAAGGAGEPEHRPVPIAGTRSVLVQVGEKGMWAGVVGVYDGAEPRLRYQKVPLDARYADSRRMLDLFKTYQDRLKSEGFAGLGLRPVPHPSGHKFVGSDACQDCHSSAYDVWKNGINEPFGPHTRATESLVHPGERSEIPRHFDPECLSCHVTGWNPQKFFFYDSGYVDLARSQHLHTNGCENCHGPASTHVAVENGDLDVSDEQIEQLRQQLRLTKDKAEHQCMECHDLDNSPDFHIRGAFEKYWQRIEHYGKE